MIKSILDDYLQKTLNDSETYVQLTNLERKCQVMEQNNFAISEFINNKKAESNYEPIKNRVRTISLLLLQTTENRGLYHIFF